jgi:glutamate dehydrogenase
LRGRYEAEKKKKIAAVIRRIDKSGSGALLSEFASAFFSQSAAEDVSSYRAERLVDIAKIAYAPFSKRKPRAPTVRVIDFPASNDEDRQETIVEVLTTNRPFILDSVLGEVQATGCHMRMVLHPMFDVERKNRSVLQSFTLAKRGTKTEGFRESFVHIHIDGKMDARARKDLESSLTSLVREVHLVTDDWLAMRKRLKQAIERYRDKPSPSAGDTVYKQAYGAAGSETVAFLEWLEDDNFVFLGMREFSYEGLAGETLPTDDGDGLGILRDPKVKVLRRGKELVVMTPEIREFLMRPEPLMITKANVKSRVHRRDYMDYVGLKLFDDANNVIGELRIIGLFTSTAFTRSVQRIPLIRKKVDNILKRAGFDPDSHSGKALLNTLEGYPRTELFQADEAVLYNYSLAILELNERPRVRALAWRDRFDRFVSVLVFVPRERYASHIRERIGEALALMYEARVSSYFPFFPEGGLARVHFILGRKPGSGPEPAQIVVEARIREIIRTFEDDLADAVSEAFEDERRTTALESYRDAFGTDYQASFSATDAINDIRIAESLVGEEAIAAHLVRRADMTVDQIALRFHHQRSPIPLSRRVPLLENLGFRVINERTYRITPSGAARVYLHDMTLEAKVETDYDLEESGDRLRAAILAVWADFAENDGFNALVLTAGLGWRDAAMLRTIGRYMRQTQIPYSLDYVWNTLNRHPRLSALLSELFTARFDPAVKDRDGARQRVNRRINAALEDVESLDDDTILRAYRDVIHAVQRTDFFTFDASGNPPEAITLKIKPSGLAFVPRPRPYREIFTHSPQVEGLHLRFGPIARGGLRWSDRPQDFRVEVLGLVKAQQVKNAVIVPVGSKGGFVPQRLPEGGSREAVFEAGRQAYIKFIDRLLAVTDNLEGDKVVPPDNVVRHDGDDPYLVVAADKGTATFSDTANGISEEHGFWLGDAFASGGSAGYDHKAMGITARGAWEAVKRHFREIDTDIQSEPFTVIGVGDMSGDVFGNGMLLSKTIKLVAAFDHRDIFIDPNPDPGKSWRERKRLFDLGRSSWQDYGKSLISKGGGVISRRDKSVKLSADMKKLLGLRKAEARPNEVINAILKLKADLLWFGGIGTYVRAEDESDLEVGDKANDAIRITTGELGVKVIGEGANLGLTQRARIAFGLKGGRCNSDAIDNSAGVNSSDMEVNIKIALAAALRSNKLTMGARDTLLKKMTDEVAALVLRNNYQQTLALSLEEARGLDNLSHQSRLMSSLEGRGLLDRQVEILPDAAVLAERAAAGEPLTRPELGVLLSYAKIVLFGDLVASGVPDDPYFKRELSSYFPAHMQKTYAKEIERHRLRREIIATQIANSMVNRGGPTIISRIAERTGASVGDITHAYAAARGAFAMQDLHAGIDALDTKIPGRLQLDMYLTVQNVLIDRIGWFLRNVSLDGGLERTATHYRQSLDALARLLPDLMPPFMAKAAREAETLLAGSKVPAVLARQIAYLPYLASAADIVLIADGSKRKLRDAARAYYEVTERFQIGRIVAMAGNLETVDYYEELAVEKARDGLALAQKRLTESVLSASKGAPDITSWEKGLGYKVAATAGQIEAILAEGRATTAKVTVAASILMELASRS